MLIDDETVDVEGAPPGILKVLRDWILVVAVAVSAALLVRTFVVQQFYISGPSMEPTLYTNNRVLVNKLSYRLHAIHRGDVVVFDRVTTENGAVNHDDLIKRVVALSGDTIEIRDCEVYVNDNLLSEPYLDDAAGAETDLARRCRVVDRTKETIPADQVFVMGDNRAESFDSRNFGPIPESLVIGRAFVVLWPFGSIAWL